MNEGKECILCIPRLVCSITRLYADYRQTEGVVIAHAKSKVPSIPDYSTIQRRINKLDIKINEHLGNDIVIALDSTGIKITNRGEWLPHKWNVRKGYLKIHVAVDIKKMKIVSLSHK